MLHDQLTGATSIARYTDAPTYGFNALNRTATANNIILIVMDKCFPRSLLFLRGKSFECYMESLKKPYNKVH